MTSMDTKDIFELLDRWEAKLIAAGVIDNQKCMGLWLKLYGDGSGSVMAEWSDVKATDDQDRKLVRTVCTMEPSSIFDFDTIEELHGGLVAQQMRVKRVTGDGDIGEECWE